MPDTFKFEANNAFVRRYLNTAERANVGQWQTSDGWLFEFHPGHGTGNPIYVRPSGNTDGSNLPKFDTLNKTANNYTTCKSLANGPKLVLQQSKGGLSPADQTQLMNVIRGSWASLSLMASRYWTNTVAPPDPPPVVVPTTRACVTPACAGVVPIVASGKVPCPVCYAFQ